MSSFFSINIFADIIANIKLSRTKSIGPNPYKSILFKGSPIKDVIINDINAPIPPKRSSATVKF